MARPKAPDKLTALQEKIRQLQAREDAILSQKKQQARKDDTRRKVIAGSLALEHWEKNEKSEFAKVLAKLLDEYVIRPSERALFPALPPVPVQSDTTKPPAPKNGTETSEVPV